MAEWLRPQTSIAENGLNIRRISVGSISCPSKKSIGWAVDVMITFPRYYGWHRPNFRGQDGRVVKAPNLQSRDQTKYTLDMRGFEILSLKTVHRLGGWC